jgi:hypothetical protein
MVNLTLNLVKSNPALMKALRVPAGSQGLKFDFESVNSNIFDRIQTLKKKADANDTKVLLDFVQKIADVDFDGKLQTIADVASAAADATMSRFFLWVGRNFMTGNVTSVMEVALGEAGVSWEPLSPKYYKRKLKLGRNPGFWRFSDKLLRQFVSGNSRRRHIFGTTNAQVTVRGYNATIKIGLGSGLKNVMADGATTGQRLEAEILAAGFMGNEEMIRKLQGRVSYYRPLLGPALFYYINNVVRSSVASGLKKAGFRMKRTPTSGMEDFDVRS